MRRERPTATYDLGRAKQLARAHRLRINGRARRFIQNRHDESDITGFVADLFELIEPRHFVKSTELEVLPGTWADVYDGIRFLEENWYVKFFIDDDTGLTLSVMSANWSGYTH